MELKAAREKAGFTQKQVAVKSKVTEQTYQRYELETREPKISTAIRIADTLKVKDLRKLFGKPHSYLLEQVTVEKEKINK